MKDLPVLEYAYVNEDGNERYQVRVPCCHRIIDVGTRTKEVWMSGKRRKCKACTNKDNVAFRVKRRRENDALRSLGLTPINSLTGRNAALPSQVARRTKAELEGNVSYKFDENQKASAIGLQGVMEILAEVSNAQR